MSTVHYMCTRDAVVRLYANRCKSVKFVRTTYNTLASRGHGIDFVLVGVLTACLAAADNTFTIPWGFTIHDSTSPLRLLIAWVLRHEDTNHEMMSSLHAA